MSHMAQEAREAPEAVQRFLDRNEATLKELGQRLRKMNPPVILTSARGSSDHAAGYLKYLSEIALGVPCASVGASVASVYGAKLKAEGALAITISQSGKSPDIVALQEAAKAAGALTVAIVNVEDSPAAKSADICLPLHAGPEKSVAATKTFITSLAACASIIAHWMENQGLKRAISMLPNQLARATQLDWSGFVDMALQTDSLYVLGRGPSFPIAAETALKLKETCALHAEAYSAAEVMHGPLEIVGQGFPVLVYAQNDSSLPSSRVAVTRLQRMGARVLMAGQEGLPVTAVDHPLLEPIAMIQSAYLAIEQLAQRLDRDPDRPRHLSKVTETV
jgi:glutamine---fructose-6-phosphate transaminase (isomerizing)